VKVVANRDKGPTRLNSIDAITNEDGAAQEEPSREQRAGGSEGQIARDVTDALGRHLKTAYGRLLDEPVPDRFVELLRQLESRGSDTPPHDPGNNEAGKDN